MSAHSIHLQGKRKKISLNISVYCIRRKSLRTQERVRLIHGKRAMGFEPLKFYCTLKHVVRNVTAYHFYRR